MTVVDLFAGIGGWDLAARELGVDPIGVEFMPEACATRAAAGFRTIRADIETMRIPDQLDGLIASPPCQDFSIAGKRAGRSGDRGRLIDLVPLWVEHARPRRVACEQVPPCEAIWNEHAERYRRLGYSTWVGVLNAADYGVPQTRRRAILVASLDHPVSAPEPTHARDGGGGLFPLDRWVSMADALGWGATERRHPTIACSRDTGGPDKEKVGGSGARAAIYDERDAGRWADWSVQMTNDRPGATRRTLDEPAPTVAFGHNAPRIVRTGQVQSGVPGTRHESSTDDPAPTVASRFDQWTLDRLATTVQGDPRIAPPGHHERQMNDAIRLDIGDALVLQSFPRDYPVQGSKTAQFLQVGNAIPVGLARPILEQVIR